MNARQSSCFFSETVSALSPHFVRRPEVAGYRCRLPVRTTGTLELGLERGAEIGAGKKIAMGAFKRVHDQRLRPPGVRDAGVELRDLALGQATPGPAPAVEQPPDLREREPGVLAEANKRDALRARGPVVPPPPDTPSG